VLRVCPHLYKIAGAIVGEQRQNESLKAGVLSVLRVTALAVPPHGMTEATGFRLSASTDRKVAEQRAHVRGGCREKRVRYWQVGAVGLEAGPTRTGSKVVIRPAHDTGARKKKLSLMGTLGLVQ
jgi:hypothetical protein